MSFMSPPVLPALPTMPLPPMTVPVASYTPLPAAQVQLLGQPWDPFAKSQHEATMNNWYMQVTDRANRAKIKLYQQAYGDWEINALHCQDLGIAIPDVPKPPVLDPVQPMPDGYWFATH